VVVELVNASLIGVLFPVVPAGLIPGTVARLHVYEVPLVKLDGV
jgi:hypothetical protein